MAAVKAARVTNGDTRRGRWVGAPVTVVEGAGVTVPVGETGTLGVEAAVGVAAGVGVPAGVAVTIEVGLGFEVGVGFGLPDEPQLVRPMTRTIGAANRTTRSIDRPSLGSQRDLPWKRPSRTGDIYGAQTTRGNKWQIVAPYLEGHNLTHITLSLPWTRTGP